MKRNLIILNSSMPGRWQQRQDTCMVNMQNVNVACSGRADDSHMYKQPHQGEHRPTIAKVCITTCCVYDTPLVADNFQFMK